MYYPHMRYSWTRFTQADISRYCDYVSAHSDESIWHRPEWLDFQVRSGRSTDGFCFAVESDGQPVCAGVLLIQPIAGDMVQGYIPAGVLYHEMGRDLLDFLLESLRDEAYRLGLMMVRSDGQMLFDTAFESLLKGRKGLSINIHLPIPTWTLRIDLSKDDETILSEMKHKGRYNTRLAGRKGVTISEGGEEDIPRFYRLLRETTSRDGFSGNSESYYLTMLKTLPQAKLFLATHEGDLLAAGIFCYTGGQALYYYGASSNIKRNLMAPYLLQWHAIRYGRDSGCRYYDFLGIAEPGRVRDPLNGVTDFKMKFGGEVTRLNVSFQVLYRPWLYTFYLVLKAIKDSFKR
jgi:peptidoglycan pentaglycine glycine transferase (the first glycine)